MSTTVTTAVPFPPAGAQLVTGPGTVTAVTLGNPGVPGFGGSGAIDISLYDSIGPTTNAPIATVKTDSGGFGSIPLNAAYSTGLYAVQRSASSVEITHS